MLRHVDTRLLVWGKKAGKVTHFLPTWLPYHLRERLSWKMWRGHIFRRLSISVNPELSPEEYGWKRDIANKILYPTSLPDNTKAVPNFILEVLSNVDANLIPPVALRNAFLGSKDYLATYFLHVLVWDVQNSSSPFWTLGIWMEEEHNKHDTISHWSWSLEHPTLKHAQNVQGKDCVNKY